ncbi:MAG: right-handed parallel beta-helix repeat-containing protein [Bacteroidetes bacterium]|nr:right-handed parallel beta-helix repeat-containing protein [Bacteroidota bacterium]
MKTRIGFMAFFLTFSLAAQTWIPITNNMTIGNNSNIKFMAGNYVFSDPGLDGVIQISGKHDIILDGDSCTVDGTNFTGYMIKISNSSNIVIKNFDSVFNYKYAVYVNNSSHIIINGNDFSRNKVDSAGWIDVWTDYTQALGGGVMMYQCRAADIYNNTMKFQNDGVALYHCDSIRLHDNDFAWNTSYGIRMFWTDSCEIYNNLASHINRPLTDPSDCGALLMIVSNNNRVENNDLSWSGDGVFLGQYQHSGTPNKNYFAYNECSWSPHNAIEATFADGNVYKHNNCNYSDYGLWLGYSFNSIVDSNEVKGNFHSGIAIDRGYSNSINHNTISDNPTGIELWKGNPITGYENQLSKDYVINQNVIEGNTQGISAINTQHLVAAGNQFNYNQNQSIYLELTSTSDTISNNDFRMPTSYHMKNWSSNDIYAPANNFEPNDSALIAAKIYDKSDNSLKGRVIWYPAGTGPAPQFQDNPPCDMAEPSSVWYAYPETGYPGPRIPDSVSFDSTQKVKGYASVKLVAGRGWDVALNYRPANDSLSQWTLTSQDTLYFWVRTIPNVVIGFQYFHIRVGDIAGNYYKYTASPNLLTSANLVWKQYKVPLAGNSQFSRSMVGSMLLDNVNYVEFHADTWDYGYTLWLDGVQFSPCSPVTAVPPQNAATENSLLIRPNPVTDNAWITYRVEEGSNISMEIYDSQGRKAMTLVNGFMEPGNYSISLSKSSLSSGTYLVRLTTSSSSVIRKMVLVR